MQWGYLWVFKFFLNIYLYHRKKMSSYTNFKWTRRKRESKLLCNSDNLLHTEKKKTRERQYINQWKRRMRKNRKNFHVWTDCVKTLRRMVKDQYDIHTLKCIYWLWKATGKTCSELTASMFQSNISEIFNTHCIF